MLTVKEYPVPEEDQNDVSIALIKVMFCSKCGSQLLEGALFCQKCGERVNSEESVPHVALSKKENFSCATVQKLKMRERRKIMFCY